MEPLARLLLLSVLGDSYLLPNGALQRMQETRHRIQSPCKCCMATNFQPSTVFHRGNTIHIPIHTRPRLATLSSSTRTRTHIPSSRSFGKCRAFSSAVAGKGGKNNQDSHCARFAFHFASVSYRTPLSAICVYI